MSVHIKLLYVAVFTLIYFTGCNLYITWHVAQKVIEIHPDRGSK